MAGAFTVISRVNDREIVAALTRLANKAKRLEPFFKNAGEEMVRSTQERFVSQMDPDGHRWQPLKPSTLASKAKRGYGSQGILTMRRHLRDSIRYQADRNGVRWGTNRIYGAIQHFGGRTKAHVIKPKNKKALAWPGGRHPARSVKHPGSTIPARPFLGVSVRDRERILEIIVDHLEMKA